MERSVETGHFHAWCWRSKFGYQQSVHTSICAFKLLAAKPKGIFAGSWDKKAATVRCAHPVVPITTVYQTVAVPDQVRHQEPDIWWIAAHNNIPEPLVSSFCSLVDSEILKRYNYLVWYVFWPMNVLDLNLNRFCMTCVWPSPFPLWNEAGQQD